MCFLHIYHCVKQSKQQRPGISRTTQTMPPTPAPAPPLPPAPPRSPRLHPPSSPSLTPLPHVAPSSPSPPPLPRPQPARSSRSSPLPSGPAPPPSHGGWPYVRGCSPRPPDDEPPRRWVPRVPAVAGGACCRCAARPACGAHCAALRGLSR